MSLPPPKKKQRKIYQHQNNTSTISIFVLLYLFIFVVQIFNMMRYVSMLYMIYVFLLLSKVIGIIKFCHFVSLLKISNENICYAPFGRMKKLKKYKPPRKMLPPSAAAGVACSSVILEVLRFSSGALLPSASEVGSTCDMLQEL